MKYGAGRKGSAIVYQCKSQRNKGNFREKDTVVQRIWNHHILEENYGFHRHLSFSSGSEGLREIY